MDNTNFTAAEGSTIKPSHMSDEHQIIQITEKTPTVPHIGKIVRGDTNSNLLTFEINRYYDGVDLCNKDIKFIVKNEYGVFTEPAVNLQYNDTLLRFSWILSYAATTGGPVTAAIEFYGLPDSGENYSFKTTPFTLKVEESLDATDITILPPVNWFVDTENRLSTLEEILSGDLELATKQDIADAISHMEYESLPIDFSEAF
ncbi:MAG: hypothetical protein K2N41_06145 [Lachnospiraceae bacterium]|nr:hypothetical protein [Lachnospiraceae bacterium]